MVSLCLCYLAYPLELSLEGAWTKTGGKSCDLTYGVCRELCRHHVVALQMQVGVMPFSLCYLAYPLEQVNAAPEVLHLPVLSQA